MTTTTRTVTRTALLLAALWGAAGIRPGAAQSNGYENLQVLPADIPRDELGRIMVENLAGLGLPRRGGVGCLYCHVGSMDVPRGEWDYASDEKAAKRTARVMMAMTMEVNERLAGLEERVAPELEVGCVTCHSGRTDPRGLPELLDDAYRAGGVDSLASVYAALRDRYYAAGAYDFRLPVLFGVARALAAEGRFDDAIRVSRLNEEHFPDDPEARRGTLHLELGRALEEGGMEALLASFDEALETEAPGVVTPSVLDAHGWPLWRADRVDEAIRLFRRNLEAFPDRYLPNESLASALVASGRAPEEGFALLERWIERHPDDDQARRVLLNLRGRGG